jgi:hypothetical protein
MSKVLTAAEAVICAIITTAMLITVLLATRTLDDVAAWLVGTPVRLYDVAHAEAVSILGAVVGTSA